MLGAIRRDTEIQNKTIDRLMTINLIINTSNITPLISYLEKSQSIYNTILMFGSMIGDVQL